MTTLTNISLMTYFTFVSIIGTIGNSVILLAYGNRWNSSKSTSVIFILILACVDLWTCLIVIPTIAIMEYRDFDAPTIICRFYSFSKNLIIISSLIISFIALDRFFYIALPHYRLLTPRRVKVLLTLFISIGIGLGTLAALAFSTQPIKKNYLVSYHLSLLNETIGEVQYETMVSLSLDSNNSLTNETFEQLTEEISIPDGANLTILNFEYKSTAKRCFADTRIISETVRDVLKHVSNKTFFTLIGIVTIFYTITFVLALQRQKPRIRALKKSLNVLNKFDSQPSMKTNPQPIDSIVTIQNQINCSPITTTTVATHSKDKINGKADIQQYEMDKFLNNNDDSNESSSPVPLPPLKNVDKSRKKQTSISDGTSDELQPSTEKLNSIKQVSFHLDNRRQTRNKLLSTSTASLEVDSNGANDTYYKLPCPCSTTRQFLIKFHFIRPSNQISKWFCCSSCMKKPTSLNLHNSIVNSAEDETITILSPSIPISNSSTSHSDALRKQLHRHRLKQLRMASTFLIITVSFVLFYLPSVLNAERIIKSPIMIYYLFLCTHALNPIIYCFMNPSLRAYVISMFNCRDQQQKGNIRARQSLF